MRHIVRPEIDSIGWFRLIQAYKGNREEEDGWNLGI